MLKIIGSNLVYYQSRRNKEHSVAEITSRDTILIINRYWWLFDPRMGVLDPGLICPTDGLNYMETPGYFGHIESS